MRCHSSYDLPERDYTYKLCIPMASVKGDGYLKIGSFSPAMDSMTSAEFCEFHPLLHHFQMPLSLRSQGGGKRGKDEATSSDGKKGQMKALQEQMESAMFRFVGNNINNPTIQEVVLNVQAMMRVSKTEDKDAIRATLEAQSDMGLCKLLSITSVSTKPEARCKALSEILFEGSYARLDEIQSQCSSACKLLPNSVFHMMLAIWGGDNATIAWADFTKMVADVIKDRALAGVNRPGQGGLGG